MIDSFQSKDGYENMQSYKSRFKIFLCKLFGLLIQISLSNSLRVRFGKAMGVKIGKNVFIGKYCILDDTFPQLISIADNVNISFLHCEGEALTIELSLKGVYVSSGSACTRLILQPSHVLTAIGRQFEEAHGSILMKVTRYHTIEDIEYVLRVFPEAVKRLRTISPIKGDAG